MRQKRHPAQAPILPKILIADDDPSILVSVSTLLTRSGYQTVSVENGEAALDALRGGDFDVALIDLEMPERDGFEVLEEMQSANLLTVPLILTGRGDIQRTVRAVRLGAFDLMEKPCNPDLLLNVVNRAVEFREIQKHATQMESIAEEWQATFDASPDILFVTDLQGVIVRCNQSFARRAGMDHTALVGRTLHELVCQDAHSSEDCPFRPDPETPTDSLSEMILWNHFYEVSRVPMRLKNRPPWGWYYSGRDISLRKAAQNEAEIAIGEVRNRERETKALLTAAKAVFESHSFEVAARIIFDSCCEATGAVSGYIALLSEDGEENEVLFLEAGGEPCTVDPSLPMPIRGLRAEAYHSGRVAVENDFEHSDWMEFMPEGHAALRNVMFAPLKIEGKTVGIMGVANKPTDFDENDIHLASAFGDMAAISLARIRNEEALRSSEEKFRQIVNNIGMGVSLISSDFRIIEMNRQMREWFPGLHVHDRPPCYEQLNAPPETRPCSCCPGTQSLRDGLNHETNCTITQDGEVRNFRIFSSPIHDSDGRVMAVIEIVADITDQMRLERELNQAQKLEAVGRLAAGIAHEINTPTQYVGDNIEFLKLAYFRMLSLIDDYGLLLNEAKQGELTPAVVEDALSGIAEAQLDYLQEQIPRAIDQSIDGVGRVAAIVQAMKEFSHPDTTEKALVDLNRCILSTITVSRNVWKYVSQVETQLDDHLPLVPCLPGEFNQVILNLIINAAHAIADKVGDGGEKGTITISTREVGNQVEIRVSDTGTGIPEEIRDQIFYPFFTTKPVGRGTGQGLPIARSIIVDKHNGSISFETEVGQGTTFIIRLGLETNDYSPLGGAYDFGELE